MAETTTGNILPCLRRVVEDQRVRELSDQDLLRQVAAGLDEAAFTALLRRHGPMVLTVCRALLRNEADAEDAFQVTFLVLAKRARSIRNPASVGSWLHGVAYRTARKLQAEFARRQEHERGAAQQEASPADERSWQEMQTLLHEELNRLSPNYREPLLLCYLQGKTLDEAAVQLGMGKSTLKTRLERGRALLRSRLLRRGLGPVAVLLVFVWPASAKASLPAGLLASTTREALVFTTGQAADGLISARVAALTAGMLNAMATNRKISVTTVLAVLTFLGVGLGGLAYTLAAREPHQEQARALPTHRSGVERLPAEQKAIEALQKAGGRLIFDRTRPGHPVVAAFLVTSEIRRFDPHFKHLKELKSLEKLILPHRMTEAAWKDIQEVKSLKWLHAPSRLHSVEQARAIAALPHLRELVLGDGDDALLREFWGMQNLTALTFSGPATREVTSGALAGFKRLRRLSLPGAGYEDAKRAGYSELTGLEELSIESRINDAGLRDLARLRKLRVLRIVSSNVSDAGLAELKPLASLRRLDLHNTRVTAGGVADLKRALPGLVVTLNEAEPRFAAEYERIKGKVKVLDANTLVFADGNRARLHIQTPKPGEKGAKEAADFLAKLIGDRPVDCFMINNEFLYRGYVGDVNLEHAMIINGWAPSNHSSTRAAETIARENKRGLWAWK